MIDHAMRIAKPEVPGHNGLRRIDGIPAGTEPGRAQSGGMAIPDGRQLRHGPQGNDSKGKGKEKVQPAEG